MKKPTKKDQPFKRKGIWKDRYHWVSRAKFSDQIRKVNQDEN